MGLSVSVLLLATALQSVPAQPIDGASSGDEAALVVRTDRVDADAVSRGLDLRVGPTWRRYAVEIEAGSQPQTVRVSLRAGDGPPRVRELTLMSQTVDARSRELASALALIIDQIPAETPPAAEDVEPPPPPAWRPFGWIGVGPRGALNATSRVDPELGVSLAGGAWLARDHLQPLAELSWAMSRREALRVDAVRLGTGAAGGAPVAEGRWWVGGALLARAQWARAAAAAVTATGWWATPAAAACVQFRGRVLVLGTLLGVDLMLPPLRAHDGAHVIRWGPVRPMATVHVGIRIPPRRVTGRS